MVPASFAESNCVLSKPPSMTHDECECLAVLRTSTPNGFPVIVSCWKLTKEELEIVNRTGRVWLGIHGESMPPVFLTGDKPFETEEPV